MYRVEVIANVELFYDLSEQLNKRLPLQHYTAFSVTQGKGKKGYACGDGIWPEENFCCLFFMDNINDIRTLYEIGEEIQHVSPTNSYTVFISESKTQRLGDFLKTQDIPTVSPSDTPLQ